MYWDFSCSDYILPVLGCGVNVFSVAVGAVENQVSIFTTNAIFMLKCNKQWGDLRRFIILKPALIEALRHDIRHIIAEWKYFRKYSKKQVA